LRLILETPTKLRVLDATEDELHSARSFLTYRDKTIEMEIKRLKSNPYMANRFGRDYVEDKMEELKQQLNKTLLFEDFNGYYTYPGLANPLKELFRCSFENRVEYPEFKLIPWLNKPVHEMYYYQKDSVDVLIKNPHANVELPTGSGKSRVILELAKKSGLKVLVVTPSLSINEQLHDDFTEALGKKNVGMFGGSKKKLDRKITIATAQSLARIELDSETHELLKKVDVLIFDECHLTAAKTFEYVCVQLLEKTPYRWFVSATPSRGDGKDKILQGVIGETVYHKEIQELQEEGYLAKINTMIFDVESPSTYIDSNHVKLNQRHVYQNTQIADTVAALVNQATSAGLPTLVLLDEHSQEELLKNRLKVDYAYARSGSDVSKIVEDFNNGKILCVVGTSAVSTGTNFLCVRLTVSWQANRAKNKTKQGAIGRSTRIHKSSGKTECKLVDFRITNIPLLKRHADERISYYKEVGPVTIVKVQN
jgi:superfamily II DNA or RNA helicase